MSMQQLNLKIDHDNTVMALNDMVKALVRADIEATELLDVWQNAQEFYNQSLTDIQAATDIVQSTVALLEDAKCTLDNGKLHMKKWKEELEALETEWQLVPSMCMLLNYAARYTDRPEDCKLGVKTAIDVLNETTLTSKYAESSFYSQDVISLLFNTTMHKTLTSCLGGGHYSIG